MVTVHPPHPGPPPQEGRESCETARATFDRVFADNVLEHLPDRLTVFREIARVLKPGGVFLFKTPNKTHDMPTLARLTPHRFHPFVNRIRGRAETDAFPTRYEVLSFKF